MSGSADDQVTTNVQASHVSIPAPRSSRERWASDPRRFLGETALDALKAIGAGLKWIREHWKEITAAYLALMFLSPDFYISNIQSFMPQAYYKLGSLVLPGLDRTSHWNVDLDVVDNNPRSLWIDRLLHARGHIVRIRAGYIPGRGAPDGSGDEAAGKNWEAGKCLFISDVQFRAMLPRRSLGGERGLLPAGSTGWG